MNIKIKNKQIKITFKPWFEFRWDMIEYIEEWLNMWFKWGHIYFKWEKIGLWKKKQRNFYEKLQILANDNNY